MAKKKQVKNILQSLSGDSFAGLIQNLKHIHEHLKFQAAKAVNSNLTLRNWLFGCHIKEYELKGRDRAKYGERLFAVIAEKLTRLGVSNCGRQQLYRYCDFYAAFLEILGTLSPKLQSILAGKSRKDGIVGTLSRQSDFPPDKLLSDLSYSHLEELAEVQAGPKRNFYISECIRGSWAVRELQRQSASHYYERASLSENKDKLARLTQAKAETLTAEQIIRNPYVFEFAGLKPMEAMMESDMEDALLTRLQDFLLELGRGFCFEARQKRILIGGEHYFVDLVFYHRITKHINSIFKSEELAKKTVCAFFAHTAADGKTYKTAFYNLDAVISVGYRVNSKRATQFRIWATNILRRHLVDGYTINQKLLKAKEEKFLAFQRAIKLIETVKARKPLEYREARGLLDVIRDYSRALGLLDDYDNGRVAVKGVSPGSGFCLTINREN